MQIVPTLKGEDPRKFIINYDGSSFITILPKGGVGEPIVIGNKDLRSLPYKLKIEKLQDIARPAFGMERLEWQGKKPRVIVSTKDREVMDEPPKYPKRRERKYYPEWYNKDSEGYGSNGRQPQADLSYKGNKRMNFKNKQKRNSEDSSSGRGTKIPNFRAYESTGDESSTSLYLLCGKFFPFLHSNSKNSIANEYFDHILGSYQIACSKRHNGNVRYFSEDEIQRYLGVVTQSVQFYYFCKSIAENDSGDTKNNSGLDYILRKFDATFFLKLGQLKERLEQYYLKPECVTFLNLMNRNYSSNQSTKSPILKICYDNIVLDDLNLVSKISSELIDTQMELLRGLISVNGMMSTIVPSNWKITLTSIKTSKVYDSNFMTLWHNSNISYIAGGTTTTTVTNSRLVSNNSSLTYLGVFNNNVSGSHLSCISIFVTSNSTNGPGIFEPKSKFNSQLEEENKISLLIFDEKVRKIQGIRKKSMAISSFLYITPYFEKKGVNPPLIENDFQAKKSSGFSLEQTTAFVQPTLDHLFGL